LTETPWAFRDADLDRLGDAGISEEGRVQALTIAAAFNHLTRVADATGVAPDYASPLPRLEVDARREAAVRPAASDWPEPRATPRLSLDRRPRTRDAVQAWEAYVRNPSRGLSAEDRRVLGSTTAYHLCDHEGQSRWEKARPRSAREKALGAFATKLTLTPWRMSAVDLEPLRRQGLDDRALLDTMGVVGFQNMESRLRLALG
jgi:alkylhydroperoxidase family enzyme